MDLKKLKTQKIEDGYGAKYHRVYSITLPLNFADAKTAMLDLQKDLDKCSPGLLAEFEKVEGATRRLKVGDKFQIHIAGPWNGPVRVDAVNEAEFRLTTLETHIEAGEIVFRLIEHSHQETIFEIESLARSRDGIVDFFYDKIPLAKMAQTQMWTSFCKAFAERSVKITSGEVDYTPTEVQIITERYDEESQQWERI